MASTRGGMEGRRFGKGAVERLQGLPRMMILHCEVG